MFDIHCHLLPGIDDGAATVEQSLAMVRHAVSDGITHMVFTPHIQPGVYDNSMASISKSFDAFQQVLLQRSIELNVAMAAEVRLCPEILPMLDNGDLPLFNGSNEEQTMLLELPHSHVPPGTEQIITWLMKQDINVLIAHPERNKELMRNMSRIEALVDLGCKLQLTAGSVAGRFGVNPKAVSDYILQQDWAFLLASDAHNLTHRPPQLSNGVCAATAIVGEQRATELVNVNPLSICGGMFQ